MRTNIISILQEPPQYSESVVDEIIQRIMTLHKNLGRNGAEEYLKELLAIDGLEQITSDFLRYQEIEPSVSSNELHALAERVLPYNDNDIEKALYSVRNILNTIPRSLVDLRDYSTQERKAEFIENIRKRCLSTIPLESGQLKSINDLIEALKDEPEISLTLACNEEMNVFQNKEISDFGCLTHRQNMLSMAANYYLNHLLGFQCNTIWLAIFLPSQYFGCTDGWVHPNGDLCNGRHFGFKDPELLPKLVSQCTDYMGELLDHTVKELEQNDKPASLGTASLYLQTTLLATDELLKKFIASKFENDTSHEISSLLDVVGSYEELLDQNQKLYFLTMKNLFENKENSEISHEQLEHMIELMMKSSESEPPFCYLWLYDAWNFMALGIREKLNMDLGSLFILTRYNEEFFDEFVSVALVLIKSDDISPELKEPLMGFFSNYIWIMINENSDTHFLYDSYLRASVSALEHVDIRKNIRLMAELGHKPSIIEHMGLNSLSTSENLYWEKRIKIIESVPA